ncbi:MAG: hypothetical protein AAF624_03535 [Bacteroidota bacterium]
MRLQRSFLWLVLIVLVGGCSTEPTESVAPGLLGRFEVDQDLFLAQFDLKTDVDDAHSVAGVATMLADPRFAGVAYRAVAGAYGMQDGLYVPANDLFDLAYGAQWSDAHADWAQALGEVTALALETLDAGGAVWIAEAGQSDFSADLVRNVQAERPDVDTAERIHVVQHSDWNEEVTTPDDLAFVRAHANYHRIPDGNAVCNGTPGFRSEAPVDWAGSLGDPDLRAAWERAVAIGTAYNGVDGRYLNEAVQQGGLDFSDVSETAWIFGFEGLADAPAFFAEFGQ